MKPWYRFAAVAVTAVLVTLLVGCGKQEEAKVEAAAKAAEAAAKEANYDVLAAYKNGPRG